MAGSKREDRPHLADVNKLNMDLFCPVLIFVALSSKEFDLHANVAPDAVRATMGSIFAMPLVKIEQKPFLDLLREWPGESVGTHLKATESYRRLYKSPTLLVMGSEGEGLSASHSELCKTLVRIPMSGGAESLNVAVATALMSCLETIPITARHSPAMDLTYLTVAMATIASISLRLTLLRA